MINLRKILTIAFIGLILAGCSDDKTDNEQVKKITKHYDYFYTYKGDINEYKKMHTVYLPVYSHVYTSEEKNEPMGITLSIRNTDRKESLLLNEISYYNTAGDLIEGYIETSYILKPMASIEFVVDLADMRGGS